MSSRRRFIKNASVLSAGSVIGGSALAHLPETANPPVNKFPRWRGFNLLDFFSPDPKTSRKATPEEHFKWMSGWGFDFVRIPIAYPTYLDIDRSKNITAE